MKNLIELKQVDCKHVNGGGFWAVVGVAVGIYALEQVIEGAIDSDQCGDGNWG